LGSEPVPQADAFEHRRQPMTADEALGLLNDPTVSAEDVRSILATASIHMIDKLRDADVGAPVGSDYRLSGSAVATRRHGGSGRPDTLIMTGVFNGNWLSFEIPYPEPGESSYPVPGGQAVVTVPPGDANPSVRFEPDAETSVTRREPDRG
jgi:hypothetical protein